MARVEKFKAGTSHLHHLPNDFMATSQDLVGYNSAKMKGRGQVIVWVNLFGRDKGMDQIREGTVFSFGVKMETFAIRKGDGR